jgi:uncharacterized membrane protein
MPDKLATHWGVDGEVNGYMGKFWGIFLLPVVSLMIAFVFLLIPRIDPLRENIEKFAGYFDVFIILVSLFLFSIFVHVILWNVGVKFSPLIFVSLGIGVLFFYTGILCEHSKRNWFVGIRTPWTLSSDSVWDKTHKLGGKLFKLCGIIALFGAVLTSLAIVLILVPVLVISVVLSVYSYLEFRKETKKRKLAK